MNKIVVSISAITFGTAALSSAVMFGISQQTEIDSQPVPVRKAQPGMVGPDSSDWKFC